MIATVAIALTLNFFQKALEPERIREIRSEMLECAWEAVVAPIFSFVYTHSGKLGIDSSLTHRGNFRKSKKSLVLVMQCHRPFS